MLYLSEPRLIPKIWGALPAEGPAAAGEVWWLYHDREGSSKLMSAGDGSRTTVSSLVAGGALPGGDRYPLLLKTLHTADRLSVQVHPGIDGGNLCKEETWIVLEALEGSWIMGGLLCGREEFIDALGKGTAAGMLRRIEPDPGDVYHIPPGTVHALGPGLTVLEVQTNCNVTYRLFDWERTDPSGNTRKLHLKEGIAAVDWGSGGVPLLLGRKGRIDGKLPEASYTLEPVCGGDGVSVPPGGLLFLVEGTLEVPFPRGAPACIAADLEGGKAGFTGSGYIIGPEVNDE